MQIYTNNGRIMMKDGKIGVSPTCCSLTCDSYGSGSGGGGGGCNGDVQGVCCVPGTGGTCGEATQCDCDDAGGTWRFAEVDGEEIIPPGGIYNKCVPKGMAGFVKQTGGAYTVCACDPNETVTVVWRTKQPHPDFDPEVSDEDVPEVACNSCRSFSNIGEFEEYINIFARKPLLPVGPGKAAGVVICGEEKCFDKTRDPPWVWGDPDGPDPSIMPGDSGIVAHNCVDTIPDSKILACRDLDDDGVDDNGTGDPSVSNPCYDQTDPAYSSCVCGSAFYIGFGSGVWTTGTTWNPCSDYGYNGFEGCCGTPGCPPCP